MSSPCRRRTTSLRRGTCTPCTTKAPRLCRELPARQFASLGNPSFCCTTYHPQRCTLERLHPGLSAPGQPSRRSTTPRNHLRTHLSQRSSPCRSSLERRIEHGTWPEPSSSFSPESISRSTECLPRQEWPATGARASGLLRVVPKDGSMADIPSPGNPRQTRVSCAAPKPAEHCTQPVDRLLVLGTAERRCATQTGVRHGGIHSALLYKLAFTELARGSSPGVYHGSFQRRTVSYGRIRPSRLGNQELGIRRGFCQALPGTQRNGGDGAQGLLGPLDGIGAKRDSVMFWCYCFVFFSLPFWLFFLLFFMALHIRRNGQRCNWPLESGGASPRAF